MALSTSSVAMMLPVTDPHRAQQFYSEKLGLPFEGTNAEGSLIYRLAGGSELVLLPRPDSTPSPSTALSFEVTGIEGEIATLAAQGVVFEDYDLPDLKTTDHVCVMGSEKAAWFLDPDGNVLCVHENL
ncbi:Glyoxalase/bleomycin resistance protein/dioxygenase [metagenome]|uniref:Glyoxalase/bleomycin resistance protein/dioxygenase n=1 Tax=metagenome TaxID=256318 RepID=A0A2P2BZH9_9ZZZZ